jgi:hypothetical protein
MALKKAEMESHREQYHQHVAQARAAVEEGRFSDALKLAASSWGYVDGMMQYERKYEGKEFESVEGIDIVLEYAPLLLDFELLERLGELLKAQRRIDKIASDDLSERLDRARALMWEAHRFWNYLEASADDSTANTDRDADPASWPTIAVKWERMQVVQRTSSRKAYAYSLCTRMDEAVLGKCPKCGAHARSRKARLLEEAPCPKCKAMATFVLINPDSHHG